MSSNE